MHWPGCGTPPSRPANPLMTRKYGGSSCEKKATVEIVAIRERSTIGQSALFLCSTRERLRAYPPGLSSHPAPGEQEHADDLIVGLAALLHDLGRTAPGSMRSHAERSAKLAKELLAVHDLPSEVQHAILHAILAHSYRQSIEPATIEEQQEKAIRTIRLAFLTDLHRF